MKTVKQEVLSFINSRQSTSSSDVSEFLGCSMAMACWYLNKFHRAGCISRTGRRMKYRYSAVTKPAVINDIKPGIPVKVGDAIENLARAIAEAQIQKTTGKVGNELRRFVQDMV